MTYLLDDLEAAGLIERLQDPADRRVRRVVATESGAAMLTEFDRRLGEVEARVLGFPQHRRAERIPYSARRLATRIDTLDPVHDHCALTELPEAEVPQLRSTGSRSAPVRR